MSRWLILSLGLLLVLTPLAAAREAATGPLAEYVAAKDDSYRWVKRSEGSVATCKYVELTLTSQTWKGTVWKHQLFLVRPSQVSADARHALLLIGGGSWREELADPKTQIKLPGEAQVLALVAEQMKMPVAILLHVPQQPLFDGKKEDEIIALTFREFLKTGDDDWPLLLPMVKSAVRAMDATQEATKKEWGLDVATFTITGASKRGWTTWLTGAVDDRAVAIAPMVIDMLNMTEHTKLQKASFEGKSSDEISEYEGLDRQIDSDRGVALRKMVDPWEYRQRLTQPKLVILGTNDRYWPLDACNLYWNDLQGEKYLIYVPNNGHGLPDRSRIVAGLGALNRRIITGKPLPKLAWEYNGGPDVVSLNVTADVKPSRVRVWTAKAPKRDFRDSPWTSTDAAAKGDAFIYDLAAPGEG
ncbi:MAG: PhoPQ-activated pathogenicity-related family protein, partial [Planctomycetaceae bacterium]|nr:PhoPQ-activated pathogenicity-related family protein [Planctomycetaceae bacterium]